VLGLGEAPHFVGKGRSQNRLLLAAYVPSLFASLAQLVEQLTLNQWVLGSSPRRGTGFFCSDMYSLDEEFANRHNTVQDSSCFKSLKAGSY
jgi:hypothetical protein